MSEPALTLEYGRPPRRRRWRRVLVGILIAGLVAVAWHYQKRVRAYVAGAYADWQYRRAFDRAWAQLPMTDGVWLAPTGEDLRGPDATEILVDLWSRMHPMYRPYLRPSTNVLFVHANDNGQQRWLTFACMSDSGVEQFLVLRGDRARSMYGRPWNTPSLWSRASGTLITLQEIKRQGEKIETTIDIDGGRNRLAWDMSVLVSTARSLMVVTPLDGLTAYNGWWPNPKGWTLVDGPGRKRELPAVLGSFAIAFMPDGRIAQATPDNVALVRVALKEASMFPLPAETRQAETFAFSPDGTKLFIGETSGGMWLVDLTGGGFHTLAKDSAGMSKAAFADDRTLYVVDNVQTIRVDVPTRGIERIRLEESGSYFGFGAAGGRVAVPCGDASVSVGLFDVVSGKLLRQFKSEGVSHVSLSPDGRVVAMKGRGFRLYDAESGAMLLDHDMDNDLDTARSRIKWSADGLRGAAAGNQYVYVWSLREPRRVVRFPHGKTGYWPDVALSSDGKRMAVSSAGSGTISYWADIDEVMGAEK